MFNLTKVQKQYFLATKIVVFGLLSWFFLHQFFYSSAAGLFFILSVLTLILFGTSIALGSLLITKKPILYSAFSLALLSFFVFFRGDEIAHTEVREAVYYLAVLIFVFISLLIYKMRLSYDLRTRNKFNFWRTLRRGLPLVFTLICLLISLAYYFSPSLGNLSESDYQIPRGVFDTAVKPLMGLVKTSLPLYSPDMSVDELLTMFSFLGDNTLNKEFDIKEVSKNPEEIKSLQAEIKDKASLLSPRQLALQRAEFSQKLNIDIDSEESLNDILYKLANAQINGTGDTYQQYIPIALALGLFFSLRLLLIIIVPLMVLLGWLIIKIFFALKFITLDKKSVKAEVITL